MVLNVVKNHKPLLSEKLVIQGGVPLTGEVAISGAKNAALPILAATLLCDEPVVLSNVPYLYDITTSLKLLNQMGVRLLINEQMQIELDTRHVRSYCALHDLVKSMRASILVLGPLLAKYGEATLALPGGCEIGARPVDLHIRGMRALGADVRVEEGHIKAKAKQRLQGASITFEKVTVGGTENILMAAVLAEGRSVIQNAAREPEVCDLAHFLNAMGARIHGVGTDTLIVDGVKRLHGGHYRIISDRLQAGTYLIAGAMTRGKVKVAGIAPSLLSDILDKLKEAGAYLEQGDNWVHLDMQGRQPKAVDVVTAPYPAIATDMQAPFMALNTVSEGTAKVMETIFENRFMHVCEMQRMGADIRLHHNTAVIRGKPYLQATSVTATDLRASASLVLAGLMSIGGETVVESIGHIDRGYECLEEKLLQLGARVRRVIDNPLRRVEDRHAIDRATDVAVDQ